MDDLISRQTAIDVMCELMRHWFGCDSKDEVREIKRELGKLPSTQLEIIRCKDCKHFEYNHPYIIQGMPVLGHEVCNAWGDGCKTDENGYCFMAERRTDE